MNNMNMREEIDGNFTKIHLFYQTNLKIIMFNLFIICLNFTCLVKCDRTTPLNITAYVQLNVHMPIHLSVTLYYRYSLHTYNQL